MPIVWSVRTFILVLVMIASLLAQDYPGSFRVILVDDQSSDDTASVARALGDKRLEIISGVAHPRGWTGKLFAVSQGVERANTSDYLLLTDADISHTPDNLRRLVARAEANRFVLTSLMAKLRCDSFAERFLIPAFVFFFAMLFPFAWANDRRKPTAAAAGGCMLVNREALVRAGGIEAIRGEIIDDCALARAVMEKTEHVLLIGEGAESFALFQGFTAVDPAALKAAAGHTARELSAILSS